MKLSYVNGRVSQLVLPQGRKYAFDYDFKNGPANRPTRIRMTEPSGTSQVFDVGDLPLQ